MRHTERATWLAYEHGLTHDYADAIVHEYEVQRRIRLNGRAALRLLLPAAALRLLPIGCLVAGGFHGGP